MKATAATIAPNDSIEATADLLRLIDERLGRIERQLAALHPAAHVSVKEAARQLSISLSTARRRVKDGTLPVVRVGRSVRVDLSKLEPPSEAEVATLAYRARLPNVPRERA